jgi:hypothetical protein
MRPTVIDIYNRLIILKYVIVHSIATPPKAIVSGLFSKWNEKDREKFDAEFKTQSDQAIASLKQMGVWEYVSPKEQAFLQTYGSNMEEHAQLTFGWRMEAAGMLMWTLNMLTEWPHIDEKLNPEFLKNVEVKELESFSKVPELRSKEDIDAKRDLIETWHWRARTQKLIQQGHPFIPEETMKRAGLNSLDDIVRFSAKAGYEKGDLPEILDEDFVFLGKPFRNLNEEEYQKSNSIIMERHFALNWLCGFAPENRWDETPTGT